MAVTTTTHLNFDGDARQALEFYRSVFGGEMFLMTYAMAHNADAVDDPERIMFGQVESADGFRIMAYDVQIGREYDPGKNPIYVSARSGSDDEAAGVWARLSEGGTVVAPFGPAPWSSSYGMVADRFGVTWIVDVAPAA